MTPPCKNCPDRKMNCTVGCEKWAEYAEQRDKSYKEREKNFRIDQFQIDNMNKGRRRSGRT